MAVCPAYIRLALPVCLKRNIGCKRNKEFFFWRHGEIFPQLKLLEAKFKLSSYLKQTKSIGIAHA